MKLKILIPIIELKQVSVCIFSMTYKHIVDTVYLQTILLKNFKSKIVKENILPKLRICTKG